MPAASTRTQSLVGSFGKYVFTLVTSFGFAFVFDRGTRAKKPNPRLARGRAPRQACAPPLEAAPRGAHRSSACACRLRPLGRRDLAVPPRTEAHPRAKPS